jgi:hypothetical protein
MKQPSKHPGQRQIRSKILNLIITKNLIWKKQISLENFRKVQGSTKAIFRSNALTVEKLVILHPSFLTPRRTLKIKKTKIFNIRKRKIPTLRKKITEGKIIFIQKRKTIVRLSLVITMNLAMMKSFS